MGQNDGMMEGRTKQTLNAPLPFYGEGIKMRLKKREIHTSWREMNVQEGDGLKKRYALTLVFT